MMSPLSLRWTVTLLLLSLLFSASANNNNHHAPTNPPTPPPYMETADTFVESDAAVDVEGLTPIIKLSFWTTPARDWDNYILQRWKGIVMRFQNHLMQFHPHQGLIDGEAIGCHTGGHMNPGDLSNVCKDNCLNLGRYCAVAHPPDKEHSGLTGNLEVMESARRLCLWIVYGTQQDTILKYFDYVTALRETECDLFLNDNCIDKVYKQVGIESSKMATCMHNSGGVGTLVDTKNSMMQQEMHRSNKQNLTYEELPHVAINGNMIENVTTLSDWQLLDEVCEAFEGPAPAICQFCLAECPNGNEFDPTRKCVWELNCGDDRTFDDWMQGVGVFANRTDSNNSTVMEEDIPEEEEESSITEEPTAAPTSAAPTGSPTEASDDDGFPDMDDLVFNVTNNNTTDSEDEDEPVEDTNTTVPEPPHPDHPAHNNNHHPKPTHSKKTPAPTPAPHHASKPTYNSPIAPPKPTTHHNNAPSTGHHNNAAPPSVTVQKKAPNTTDSSSVIEFLALTIVCLGGLIVGVFLVQRYRTGKDVYATVDRGNASGLASTASHTADDLELHVEMGTTKGKRRDGYAPPAKAQEGTWG